MKYRTSVRIINCVIDVISIKILTGYVLSVYILINGAYNPYDKFPELSYVITLFGYYILLEFLGGRTIGKYFTQTKVVRVNGDMPTFYEIIVRTVIRLIPIGDAVSFFKTGIGWHDNWSETQLIKAPLFKKKNS